MAEEFALEQRLGHRGAVEGDKRTSLRALARCRPRATSSLPVPVSPSMSAVIDEAAAVSISCSTSAIAEPVPTISANGVMTGEVAAQRADLGLQASLGLAYRFV